MDILPSVHGGFRGRLNSQNDTITGSLRCEQDVFVVTIHAPVLWSGAELAAAQFRVPVAQGKVRFLDDVVCHLTSAVPHLIKDTGMHCFREVDYRRQDPCASPYDYFVTFTVANVVVHSPVSYSLEHFPVFRSSP